MHIQKETTKPFGFGMIKVYQEDDAMTRAMAKRVLTRDTESNWSL